MDQFEVNAERAKILRMYREEIRMERIRRQRIRRGMRMMFAEILDATLAGMSMLALFALIAIILYQI